MPIIPQPIRSLPDRPENRPCVRQLQFAEKGKKVPFYLRGAITYPMPSKRQPGIAVMAGIDIFTQDVWLFSEQEFWSIEYAEGVTGEDLHGVLPFIMTYGASFTCFSYFISPENGAIKWANDTREACRKMGISVELVPVLHNLLDIGDDIILRYDAVGRLKSNPEGVIANLISMPTASTEDNPGAQVLRILLAGYETWYRK